VTLAQQDRLDQQVQLVTLDCKVQQVQQVQRVRKAQLVQRA
jgi:hypothetical protein